MVTTEVREWVLHGWRPDGSAQVGYLQWLSRDNGPVGERAQRDAEAVSSQPCSEGRRDHLHEKPHSTEHIRGNIRASGRGPARKNWLENRVKWFDGESIRVYKLPRRSRRPRYIHVVQRHYSPKQATITEIATLLHSVCNGKHQEEKEGSSWPSPMPHADMQ